MMLSNRSFTAIYSALLLCVPATSRANTEPPQAVQDPVHSGLEFNIAGIYQFNESNRQSYGGGGSVGFQLNEIVAVEMSAFAPSFGDHISNIHYAAQPPTTILDSPIPEDSGIPFFFALGLKFTPLSGPFSVFVLAPDHSDLFITMGAGPTWLMRSETETSAWLDPDSQQKEKNIFAFTAYFGLGARLFITRQISIRLEARDYVFSSAVPSADATHEFYETRINHNVSLLAGIGFLISD
jgi:outer membrane beta-barrel protein